MRIEEKTLKHWIENFYGYGSWDARIWFVGYEEGGGDLPEEVAEKFNYFDNKHAQGTSTLCDIRDLYRHVSFQSEGPRADLFTNLYEHRFDRNALLHGAWKNLIAFVHGYRGKKLPDLLVYQKKSFLSQANNEALIQLYPLPSTHNHAWYYAWLDMPQFGFLKSRALYEEHVYQSRMNVILKSISIHKPEVVLMYGMSNINVLKESVQWFFPAAKFKMVQATNLPASLQRSKAGMKRRQTPQHHRADFNGTILLITTQVPTLRHNRIETGFDWQEFGRSIKKWN